MKKSILHGLIPSCTFINFWNFAILHVYSILHDYKGHQSTYSFLQHSAIFNVGSNNFDHSDPLRSKILTQTYQKLLQQFQTLVMPPLEILLVYCLAKILTKTFVVEIFQSIAHLVYNLKKKTIKKLEFHVAHSKSLSLKNLGQKCFHIIQIYSAFNDKNMLSQNKSLFRH